MELGAVSESSHQLREAVAAFLVNGENKAEQRNW